LGNYLWLDSQDIAGVDKIILKSVPVWILGVQRESNEIKRTLAQIPASVKKPKPADVATLELGQFVACFGKHSITTYVQPAWMNDAQAQQVATGQLAVETAAMLSPGRPRGRTKPFQEDDVKQSEADELVRANDALRRENDELRRRLDRPENPDREVSVQKPRRGDVAPAPASAGELTDQLYEAIRARLTKDPVAIRVAMTKPAIDVDVTIEIVKADGSKWLGRTALMIKEGFFKTRRKSGEVYREAHSRGMQGVAPRADEACKKLWEMGFLTRDDDGYQEVPDMKINIIRG
jgi:hypothetical protein